MGLPTVFIRTIGCNLRCGWCDTKYAWDGGQDMDIDTIHRQVKKYPQKNVCITGGEPLLQEDIFDLLDLLNTWSISVETNGSLDISRLVERDLMVSMDYKLPSSDMSQRMRDENLKLLRPTDQLKMVISDEEDFRFASKVISADDIKSNIVFQPAWGTDIKIISQRVIDEGLDVRVLPQLHKIIWGEKRGV